MNDNTELVFRTEEGISVRVDAEAITTLVQEMLCKGKLEFVRVDNSLESGTALPI